MRFCTKPFFPHMKIESKERVSLEKIVGIIDEMPEYAARLAVYLNGNRNFPYRAVVLSSPKEAEGYVKRDAMAAILAAKRFEKEVLEFAAGTKTALFLLQENQDESGAGAIYRYQSAKEISRRFTEQKAVGQKIPVLGFFSPAGGAEAELLSRNIAKEFGKKKKVLYFSLFPFSCYGREGGDGLSEVMFFLRQKAEERGGTIRALLQREEYMDAIGPVRWFADLENVTQEDLKQLLCGELWDTEYRAFVIAVGRFDQTGRAMLHCCDKVLVPVWETTEGRKLQEEFRRQLKESEETRVYSGMMEFSVFPSENGISEEAVKEAVRKGGEVFERSPGEDEGRHPQTDIGAHGSIGRAYR